MTTADASMPEHTSSGARGQSASAVPEGPERYFGRDLSWLRFNERVLTQAEDPSRPLLERVRFGRIFCSNLDEFFMKRVAQLQRARRAGLERTSADGKSVRQQLADIRTTVLGHQHRLADCYAQQLIPSLADEGIHILCYSDLDERDQARVDAWFDEQIFPVLTPLAVDPGHRFPFISNLSENLGIVLSRTGGADRGFARVKIPEPVPRLVSVPVKGDIGTVPDPQHVRFIFLDEVLMRNLDEVFPGMMIEQVMPFRVTRGAGMDVDSDDGDDNLIEHVESELRQRRFADPVRIEAQLESSREVTHLLLSELRLGEGDLYRRPGPLEFDDLAILDTLDRPDLRRSRWTPVVPARLRDDADIFSIIRERDVLVHHPYDSFALSVERFIDEAADDPDVLAIKQTIYRTSRDSPFIESLIRAADANKAVACMVELRARFDEDRNVRLARMLEDHGVHVAYGVAGLKTHCKCSLVVRREADGLRRYAHIGTGNYHPYTAQLYTDCGLLTCEPRLTEDVADVFNALTGRSLKRDYARLLVAPHTMRTRFLELIDAEVEAAAAGRPARISAKMNSLEDAGIIEKLYEASNAGVSIELVVRGFCTLRPKVPGMSENITVRSVVGRFLEHARIFHFAAGQEDPVRGAWFIGSADWMSRNLDSRVEVIVPIDDHNARAELHRVLSVSMDDRRSSWDLQADGGYTKMEAQADADPESSAVLGTFEVLCRDALDKNR